MEDELILEIKQNIKEAEELGERPSFVEHYKTMLNYYVTCLDVLSCDIFNANQQLAMKKMRNAK